MHPVMDFVEVVKWHYAKKDAELNYTVHTGDNFHVDVWSASTGDLKKARGSLMRYVDYYTFCIKNSMKNNDEELAERQRERRHLLQQMLRVVSEEMNRRI